MTTKVIFRWHPYGPYWLVLDQKDKEMMKFPDCGNLARLLLGLDKRWDCIVDFPILKVSEYKEKPKGGEENV